ncbi:protein phosphatase type 2A phosphotyrosyl phosphatase activator [Pseudozyma hubeiensis SY62]|uniref:Serine/threonine-protein phosphatase 2A activator n=1 Tax=Pseudozyma hubeiensis (strain SY62) TaxID=1305764 RepID=R9PK17_PSEHS|nr:protein phosphatase type 2A phosphotyrosyl phosphatase activator [Pseudozyma hubeiensis SY62]GAC98445.1 protein phosphatase type 2A phosphotyrosyl phosphatase activator [Pseudozyma hubeiensis SY62]
MPMITPALRRAQAGAATPAPASSSSPAASSSTTATLPSQPLPDLPRIPLSPTTLSRIAPPIKKIHSDSDLESWKRSSAYSTYTLFLQRICEASVGKPTRLPSRPTSNPTTPVEKLISLLYQLDSWTDEIEPQSKPQRFGNLAFRDWGQRLGERIEQLHYDLLPEQLHPFVVELREYLMDGFGSFVRIDYGSGHEFAFFAWLCYLYRLGFFDGDEGDEGKVEEQIGVSIFPLYLMVVWRLQDRYGLEPAGSHGVWGLDDFQFIPYIIGSSQLRSQSSLRPNQIITVSSQTQLLPQPSTPAVLISTPFTIPASNLSGDAAEVVLPNLYLTSLLRIQVLKRGPFHEHSPLLWDIATTVPNWVKVHAGMLKMYAAECLGKRVVVQHFPFGGVGWVWQDAPENVTAGMAKTSSNSAAAGGRSMALGGLQGNMSSMGRPTERITRMPAAGGAVPARGAVGGVRLGSALGLPARSAQTSRPTGTTSSANPQAPTKAEDTFVPPLGPTRIPKPQ